MKFETFNSILFCLHILIAQGGFIFAIFYKSKNVKNVIIKAIILFFVWLLLNYICNGCPLTHLENMVTKVVYGKESWPNYSFSDSWAYEIINLL